MLAEKQRLEKVNARREFLIDELVKLDEDYLDKPLYEYSIAELEMLHIAKKNKPKHVRAFLNGVTS